MRISSIASGEEGKEFSGFDLEAIEAILNYSWPGNVRELENVIRRVIVFNSGPAVKAEMLPEPIYSTGKKSPLHAAQQILTANEQTDSTVHDEGPKRGSWVPKGMSLAEIEREIIEDAIERCNNNVTEAARQLGVSPSTLYRKRVAWAEDQ